MRPRRSRLRDKVRHLFSTPASDYRPARFVATAPVPRRPASIDCATVRLPVSNGRGYQPMPPEVKARNRATSALLPRQSIRSAVGL